jgi:hypothetical protein
VGEVSDTSGTVCLIAGCLIAGEVSDTSAVCLLPAGEVSYTPAADLARFGAPECRRPPPRLGQSPVECRKPPPRSEPAPSGSILLHSRPPTTPTQHAPADAPNVPPALRPAPHTDPSTD